jgi:hypothetical protein
MVATKHTEPLFRMRYSVAAGVVTILSFVGRTGTGSLYEPDTVVSFGVGNARFSWTAGGFADSYDAVEPLVLRHMLASAEGAAVTVASPMILTTTMLEVRIYDRSSGAWAPVDGTASLRAW